MTLISGRRRHRIQRARVPEEQAKALETVKLLAEHGVDIGDRPIWLTALHAALPGLRTIGDLVSKGVDVNEIGPFDRHRSALRWPAGAGYRRPPPVDPAPLSSRRGRAAAQARRHTADKSGVVVVLQRTADLELGRDGTQE
jgi:hypothetical protein